MVCCGYEMYNFFGVIKHSIWVFLCLSLFVVGFFFYEDLATLTLYSRAREHN